MSRIILIGISVLFFSCQLESGLNIELYAEAPIPILQPRFTVEVYGYDPNWVDVPSDLIAQDTFSATQLPFTFNIKIPDNPAKSIQYLNRPEDARYYITLDWDSNGNGCVCPGDVIIDYDLNNSDVNIESNRIQRKLVIKMPNEYE